MSSDSLFSEDAELKIEIVSPEEIRQRARAPQSSGLSSSLAKCLSRSTSLPSNASTPTSLQCEARTFSPDTFESRFLQASIPEETQEASEDSMAEGSMAAQLSSSRPIIKRPKKVQKPLPISQLAGSPEEDDAFVPPHMMSLPAYNGKPDDPLRPGSLFEGVGRKLRGMDAVRFRRSVMRQTGFLEPATENIVH